jgi:CHASE2 domain-containing sensor protein
MRRLRGVSLRTALVIAAALAAAGVALAADAAGALDSLELSTVDARFSVRGGHAPRKDIVLVGLDARSVAALGLRPPLPRSYHARMLDRLRQAHPKLIAYDVQFLGATGARDDGSLIAAIRRARPVLLATHDTEAGPVPVPARVRDPGRIGASIGSVGVLTDSDGKIRRMPYAPVELKAFPVKAAELVRGRSVSERHFPGNAAWIDFAGPPGTIKSYAFSDVLAGRTGADAFKDKIVFVGLTDPAEKDVFSTDASSKPMAGTEVLASSLGTILNGFALRPASGVVDLLLLLALAALPALVGLRAPALFILLASALALALVLAGVQLAFNDGRIVTLTYPLLALVVSTAGAGAVDLFIETRARRSLEESIDRLVAQVRPGGTIGEYQIEAMVARGGMGVIYRAKQAKLDRVVALKVIAPEAADDEDFRARFKREALLAASIEHPNVVPVYEAGEHEGLLYLAMRFISGSDLRSLLRSEGPLDPGRAAALAGQVAAALDEAHAAGLVHRDVKPANVLIAIEDGRDHAYLTDFGLTKRLDSDSGMTETGMFVGTVDYMSPEQLRSEAVDGRADIYALGCVCFELLTNHVPFERDSEVAKLFAHASSPPPSASELRPELPAEVDTILQTAMAKQPDARYATATEFATALTAALVDHPPPPAAPTRPAARPAAVDTVPANGPEVDERAEPEPPQDPGATEPSSR